MGYWYAGQWYDQQEITLSVFDPSFLFGATIFTTLRVFNQSLGDPRTHWQAHGDRLRQTVQQLGWAEPHWDRIQTGAAKVAQQSPVVRVTLLSDGRELILGRSLPDQLAQKQQQGIKAWLAADPHYQRPQADFKTGNYLGAWLALQRAIQRGAGEAILLTEAGQWLETSTGNLWGFAAGTGTWYTPPTGGILPGVMRSHLIQQLQCSGISCIGDQPWTAEFLSTTNFAAIAYSNSVVGVVPFTEILGATMPQHYDPDQFALRQLQSLCFSS